MIVYLSTFSSIMQKGRKTMKRILSLALAMVMVLSMVPATVFATEATPALPTATVYEIQNDDLTFAMNFVANGVTEEQLAYYGNWYADFELTINKEVVLDANGTGDGYLSGQYDEWSENWVNVPFDKPVTLEANKALKIMAFAAEMMDEPGLKYTYQEVFEVVKDFKCGVYFTPEFLEANPDLEVTLELRMYNPADETESYCIGQSYAFQNSFVARNTATGKLYDTVAKAILAAQAGETVALIRDVEEEMASVLTDVTLDLNGHTLTAEYVTCFGDIIDSSIGNTGLLKVSRSRILIQKGNAQLPVKDGEGYRFVEVLNFNKKMKEETKFVFQPLFEEGAHALLLTGKEATGVSVMVRVSWTQTQGTRTQDFEYNDSYVQDFINSFNTKEEGKYGQQLTLTLNGASSIDNLTFTAVVISDLGVQFTSADVQDDTTGGETGNVTVKDNMVAEEVTINGDQASAVVPEGTLLQENTTSLTLTVQEMDESNSNITLGEDEETKSVDVHIEGIAANNTVPMMITIKEFAAPGLNEGNLKLYHVENGETVEMTRVAAVEDFSAHNQYCYDPITGDVALYMATFSEIALVSGEAKWEGNFDYTWYTNKVTRDNEYIIANADQLAAFGAIVGGMAADIKQDSFEGKTIKLINDIDLNDFEDDGKIFYPIGYNSSDGLYEKTGVAVTTGFYNFCGTFDGNGHTISNFYHNTWEMKGDNNYYDASLQYFRDGMGLFGRIYKGTVKNLTVMNFSSDGEYTTTGVIAAYADGATFENIAIFNCNPRVYNIGNGGIVGCVGWYATEEGLKTTFKNITVDNSNKISALWGSYDVACGGIVGQYYPISGQTSANKPTNGGLHFENCHISAQMDVYNDVCGNYQYYAYRYAGMLIGSVRENVTIDGHIYPDMKGITAEGCTVHFGTWNDYYYCEFEKNGHPSYSGPTDYKFSRVPNSEIDTSNGKENATCIGHNHTEVEDNQAIYLPFNNLVTGYGWGVTTKVVGEMDGVKILDREEGSSVVKFEKADSAKESYTVGTTVTIGELFGATEAGLDEKTQIKSNSIQVAVSPVGETSTAGGTYTPNAEDWTKGTLTFTGNGTATITITDYYFCTPTTITVTVTEKVAVEKFEAKFTGNFLYRVGNQNAVSLNSLFKAKEGAQLGTVQVTVETVHGATGAYTPNATWTNGTIQFSGTGIVKVTITDNDYCIPLTLTLEVVDAWNATGATSATDRNIVMLNNAGFSSLDVKNGYTLYGNGFTLTASSDLAARNMSYGFVQMENGVLDNVQIKCPDFAHAILYTKNTDDTPKDADGRFYNIRSAVVADKNSKILNSYISGGRAAVYASSGTLLIDNTTIEGGAAANIHTGTCNVTLRDVTLIQEPRLATTNGPKAPDEGTMLMGLSVLVMCDSEGKSSPVTLEGTLTQYAWANEEHKQYVPEDGKSVIPFVLNQAAYVHEINGKDSLNLGIVFMMSDKAPVDPVKNGMIIDNRVNKNEMPYEALNVNTLAYVYSYTNAQGTSEDVKETPNYNPTTQDASVPSVNFVDTNSAREFETSFDAMNGNWVSTLKVDVDQGIYSFSFDKLLVQKHGENLDYTVTLSDGTEVDKSAVITLNDSVTKEFVLTITDDQHYDKNGVKLDGVSVTRTHIFRILATKTSIQKPEWVSTELTGTGLVVGNKKKSDWQAAVPVLEGLSVKYWSKSAGKEVTLAFSDITFNSIGQQNGTNNSITITKENEYTLVITTSGFKDNPKDNGMPVVVANGGKNTLYFTVASSGNYVSSSSTSRTISITYTFTDANNTEPLTLTRSKTVSYDGSATKDYSKFCKGQLADASNSSICLAPDTLITMADGTQKEIQYISVGEEILTWNFYTGAFEVVPAALVQVDGEGVMNVLHLYFEDGTELKVLGEHGIFDADLNDFIFIDEFDVENYLGHSFVQKDGNSYKTTKLVRYEITTEDIVAYTILAAYHYNVFAEGMLTNTPAHVGENFFNPFDICEGMKYDEEQIEADIAEYGLYSYEDFAHVLTEEQFNLLNLGHFKVSVGKGRVSFDGLIFLIENFINR